MKKTRIPIIFIALLTVTSICHADDQEELSQEEKVNKALQDIEKSIDNMRETRAIRYGVPREKLDRMAGDVGSDTAKIKIIDKVQRASSSANYFYLEGIVKNTGDVSVEYVKVKVRALDSRGKLVLLKASYTEPTSLDPGQEGTYSILMRDDKDIKTFNYSILYNE